MLLYGCLQWKRILNCLLIGIQSELPVGVVLLGEGQRGDGTLRRNAWIDMILGRPVCRTKLPQKILISKRKMVRKTTPNNFNLCSAV